MMTYREVSKSREMASYSFQLCSVDESYTEAWVNGGFSRCFLEIVGSLSSAGIIILGGMAEIVLAKPRKSTVPYVFPIWMLGIHLASVLLAASYVIDIVLKCTLEGLQITGVDIMEEALGIISWLFSLILLVAYRRSIAKRGIPGFTLVLFWCINAIRFNLYIVSWNNPQWFWQLKRKSDIFDFTLFFVRYFLTGLVLVFGLVCPIVQLYHRNRDVRRRNHYQLLINEESESESESGRASSSADTKILGPSKQNVVEGGIKKASGSTFRDTWKKVKILFPYVWPKGRPLLQFRVVVCFILLAGGRVVNVFVPIYYKKIVNALSPAPTNGNKSLLSVSLESFGRDNGYSINLPVNSILIYVFLRFLQGGSVGSMGVLNNSRQFLWIPVQQFTSRMIQLDVFAHLHSLSLRWHLSRKTGEILRAMDRGTTSITGILNYLIFSILPTFADLGVAIVYFVIAFDAWFGLIVFLTMSSYILVTIGMAEWRTKYRREMNLLDNEARTKAVDSLLNFETVKYYNAEGFEVDRYHTAIKNYQFQQWKSLASLNLLNTAQNLVIISSLLGGCFLCAYRVTQGVLEVGDFVLFVTYLIQLYGPLNWFGTLYQTIQQSFIDMENMFDLLEVSPEVTDQIDAAEVTVAQGKIEFRNVSFSYLPEKCILTNISFLVEPGQSLALVGPSGSGKSTILRLLFRFYDLQHGTILLDDQNIQTMKQSSLRNHIGVVPQDTVLFNDTIQYNIRYGRPNATDGEVQAAARYADIHDHIQTFPNKYFTKVGERGLKVSGGEKQRVAIARTILKSPEIILLDEATSALDTQTERNIQSSLTKVCQGRTTIIVAHRLSTVVHVDQILVIKDGSIIERGSHSELLASEGFYCEMWNNQQHGLEESDLDLNT